MNVVVFGGSFNPVHLSHVMLAMHLSVNDPTIDLILAMVCYEQKGKTLESFDHRYEMCKRAFRDVSRVEVSDLERELGGESITLRTVRELKRRNPTWSIRFVIGGDLISKAPNWEGWDELIQEACPLVVGRAGIISPNGPTPIAPAISSTEVREGLARRDWKTVERFVPRSVVEYLKAHDSELYVPEART